MLIINWNILLVWTKVCWCLILSCACISAPLLFSVLLHNPKFPSTFMKVTRIAIFSQWVCRNNALLLNAEHAAHSSWGTHTRVLLHAVVFPVQIRGGFPRQSSTYNTKQLKIGVGRERNYWCRKLIFVMKCNWNKSVCRMSPTLIINKLYVTLCVCVYGRVA